MSLMTLLRRAFGFSPDSEDEDDDYNPTVPTYAAGVSSGPKVATEASQSAAPAVTTDSAKTPLADTEVAAALPENLFDAVIEIFNNAQPDFVKKCLDTEAQRRYLIDSIDAGLREQAEQAMRLSADRWDEEKSRLQARISELEGDDNAMAILRKENHRLQLSVDRQKRALLDRINDLESQVAKQAEEKERYYSRRKPSAIEEELNQAKARIEELEAAAAAKENEVATPGDVQKADNEEYEARIAECRQQIDELTAECEKLREEAERQATLKEQLEVKTAMSDNMINDLRNQAASARRELESLQHEQIQAVEQIQKELDGFEELKARKDAKIAELQEANASLRRTIETNLYNQANSEMRLRKEIKDLQAQLEAARTVNATETEIAIASEPLLEMTGAEQPKAPEKPASRRRGRPRKVRIDSDLDNTDWFSGGKHDDPDFGYHEPPRKPVNDSEAQLSLF